MTAHLAPGWYWERGVRSVANSTREDARELLELAAEIPIETTVNLPCGRSQ